MASQVHERTDAKARDRTQLKNPLTGRWVKIDTKTGQIVDVKKSDGPYKGVAKKTYKK